MLKEMRRIAKDPPLPSLSRLHEVKVLGNTAPTHGLELATAYIVLPLVISLQALSKISPTFLAIDGLQVLWKGIGTPNIWSSYSAAPTRTSADDLCEEGPRKSWMGIHRQPLFVLHRDFLFAREGVNLSIYKDRHQYLILLPLSKLCRTCWTSRYHGQRQQG